MGTTSYTFFKGEAKESPHKNFVYWSDEGQLRLSGCWT